MRFNRALLTAAVLLLFVASGALAQGTTGQITGTVKLGGDPVPGVTITATSSNLQGSRAEEQAAGLLLAEVREKKGRYFTPRRSWTLPYRLLTVPAAERLT